MVEQVGGDHYQAEYQHWDWVSDIGMGYLPGNATKYVSRWRKKNGIDDLKKAMSYIDKMMLIQKNQPDFQFSNPIGNGYKIRICTDRFVEVNKLEKHERSICEALCYKCDSGMLRHARATLQTLLVLAGGSPSGASGKPPSGGNVGPFGGNAGTGHPAPFGYNPEVDG